MGSRSPRMEDPGTTPPLASYDSRSIMPNIIGLGLDATATRASPRRSSGMATGSSTDLHAGEIAYSTGRREPAIDLAGRFAAKEAVMKALGTGHSQGRVWRKSKCSGAAARRNCSFTAAPDAVSRRWAAVPRC